MKILSLFDGMSCGHIALDRAGVDVEQYYASEMDKHAIKVSSGSTGVACVTTNCKFIGIELDPGYFEVAKQRIEATQ